MNVSVKCLLGAVLAAFMLGSVLGVYVLPRMFYLMPPTEGLTCGLGGFQTDLTSYSTHTVDEDLPSPYSWVVPVTFSAGTVVRTDSQDRDDYKGEIVTARGQPYIDSSHVSRPVTYYTKISQNDTHATWRKVVGLMQPWTFDLQVYLPAIDHDFFNWGGTGLWLEMGIVKWNNAYNDPDNPSVSSDAGYSIPMSAYIESFDPYGGGKWQKDTNGNYQLPSSDKVAASVSVVPTNGGANFDLFSDPNQPTNLTQLWYNGMYDVMNTTLATDPHYSLYPDTLFENHVWFRIQLNTFKPFLVYNWMNQITERWYPSILYHVRVYVLQLGEFTYITPRDDIPGWNPIGWTQVFNPAYYLMDSICKALNIFNPFSIFGTYAGFAAFLFICLVIFLLIWIGVWAVFGLNILNPKSKPTRNADDVVKLLALAG